jgi:predicted metal-dependent hydrolase
VDWCDNDPVVTEFFHALSITFPAGETFFIDTVLHYAPRLQKTHAALYGDVELFFKQEAAHTYIHERWNARIHDEFGHDMDQVEKRIELILNQLRRHLCPLDQLAITACLEHFTAGLGHILIGSRVGKQLLASFKEPQRSLWAWHAVEEIEHKKVAFDVYQAMGGGYFRRALMMLFVTPIFLARTISICLEFCMRRKLPLFASFKHLVAWICVSPGFAPRFIPHWLLWFSPSYHPRQHDAADHPGMFEHAALLKGKMEDGVLVFGPDCCDRLPTSVVIGPALPATTEVPLDELRVMPAKL